MCLSDMDTDNKQFGTRALSRPHMYIFCELFKKNYDSWKCYWSKAEYGHPKTVKTKPYSISVKGGRLWCSWQGDMSTCMSFGPFKQMYMDLKWTQKILDGYMMDIDKKGQKVPVSVVTLSLLLFFLYYVS